MVRRLWCSWCRLLLWVALVVVLAPSDRRSTVWGIPDVTAGSNDDAAAESQDPPPQQEVVLEKCSTNQYNLTFHPPSYYYKNNRETKMAYRMAALSTLVYYPFHRKKDRQDDGSHHAGVPLEFRLISTRNSWFQLLRCRLERILQESMPFVWIRNSSSFSCRQTPSARRRRHREHPRHGWQLRYWLYDWHEPTVVPGVHYHDTDLLVATSVDQRHLVITFAGTASAADHVTNLQTFEWANHSQFYSRGNSSAVQGSLHRGILNAYSRVERGLVLAFHNDTGLLVDHAKINSTSYSLTHALDRRFGSCYYNGQPVTNSMNSTTTAATQKPKKRKRHRGCRSRNGGKLMVILRELVIEALKAGKNVHLSGHSLGGGIATMMGLDMVINHPEVPVRKLHLWTFGAPQIADDIFLQSALQIAPRLRSFVDPILPGGGHYHRYVTLSDQCQYDLVVTIAGRALPHSKSKRGRILRRLGGLRGTVVHLAEPHVLLTPEQVSATVVHLLLDDDNVVLSNATKESSPVNDTVDSSKSSTTTTRSSIHAHATMNYLRGISRESREHPLSTDLPIDLRQWMGEPL